MITTCERCGGLIAEPGEMYAGRGCECPPSSSGWLGRRVQIEEMGMGTVVSDTDEGISIRMDKTGNEMWASKYGIQESTSLWQT